MKSKKELDEIKEEVEKFDTKLHELTEEELEQVTGGAKIDDDDDDFKFTVPDGGSYTWK